MVGGRAQWTCLQCAAEDLLAHGQEMASKVQGPPWRWGGGAQGRMRSIAAASAVLGTCLGSGAVRLEMHVRWDLLWKILRTPDRDRWLKRSVLCLFHESTGRLPAGRAGGQADASTHNYASAYWVAMSTNASKQALNAHQAHLATIDARCGGPVWWQLRLWLTAALGIRSAAIAMAKKAARKLPAKSERA